MHSNVSTSIRKFIPDERCRFRGIINEGMRVVMRLTYRCNMACPHCLVGTLDNSNELDFNEWKQILKDLNAINTKKVLLTGGEPLMHKDVLKITEFISGLNIPVDLNSNLYLMTKSMMKDFYNAGLTEISVSIEGTPEIHDKMHAKPGAYSKILNSLSWADESGIKVDTSCCLTKVNKDGLYKLLSEVQHLPVQSFTISRMFPIGHGYKAQNNGLLSDDELSKIYSNIKDNWILKSKVPLRMVGLLGFPSKSDCMRGRSIIGITPQGNVVDCVLGFENLEGIPDPMQLGFLEAVQYIKKRINESGHRMCY